MPCKMPKNRLLSSCVAIMRHLVFSFFSPCRGGRNDEPFPPLILHCLCIIWKIIPIFLDVRPLFCITDVLSYLLVGLVMYLLLKCLAVAPFVLFYKWNKWGLEPKRNPNNVRSNSFLLLNLVSFAGGALSTKITSTVSSAWLGSCAALLCFNISGKYSWHTSLFAYVKIRCPSRQHGNKARQWTVARSSFNGITSSNCRSITNGTPLTIGVSGVA